MTDPVTGTASDWTPPPDPTPTPTTTAGDQPPDAELLARFAPERIAVVDRQHLYICRPDVGTWLPLGDGRITQAARGTLIVLIQHCRAAAGYADRRAVSIRQAQECVAALSALIAQLGGGVMRIRQDDFDTAPIVPLRGGGGIHLRTGDIFSQADLPPCLVSDTGMEGIDYRPDALSSPPPLADVVERHYGKVLMRRFARHLLAPDKRIDAVRLPRSSSGKSTLADALENALPGQVAVADASASFSAQGLKFSSPAMLLATHRLVIFDEADKITAPPPPGALNALTARRLRIEPKGRDAYYAPRRANALMLGADWPALDMVQGADTRFVWGYDAHLPVLPGGIWEWMMSAEGAAWLATWMVDAAIDIALNGDDTETDVSGSAAQAMMTQNSSPVVDALGDLYEPGDGDDWCSISSIKAVLAAAGIPDDINSRTMTAALSRIAPESQPQKRRPEPGAIPVAGRKGLRRRE